MASSNKAAEYSNSINVATRSSKY